MKVYIRIIMTLSQYIEISKILDIIVNTTKEIKYNPMHREHLTEIYIINKNSFSKIFSDEDYVIIEYSSENI